VQTWLVKSEPDVYPWASLVAEGRTRWDGIRNYQARNHLRAMKVGDRALYYHTGDVKAVVAVAEVVAGHYPDPTAPGEDWSAVDLAPVGPLPAPVPLSRIKADPALAGIPLLRQSRLSVLPISEAAYRHILALGGLVPRP